MIKLIGLFMVASLLLTSCNNRQKQQKNEKKKEQVNDDSQQEFKKLNDFLQKLEEPIQTFIVTTNQVIKVKGKQGTIISIDPADLELENGQAIGKEVTLKLKEIQNQEQLRRANAQTVSDGQLLVSGGAYYISISSNGQKIKLKEGKIYKVKFPKLSKNEMALYYGQRAKTGEMNWKKTYQKLEVSKTKNESQKVRNLVLVTGNNQDTTLIPMDHLTKQQEKEFDKEERVYKPVEINQFGWINCDRLYNQEAPSSDLSYNITNNVSEVNYVKVYLIFKDINALVQSSYFVKEGKTIQTNFNQIPIGLKVRFLAVCYQNGKIFATLTKNKEVSKDQNEKLTLKAMSEREFNNLLKELK